MTAALDCPQPHVRNWHADRALSQAAGSALKTRSDYRHHDAALERLDALSPALTNGYYNHAPMVVEALSAMGQGREALAWLDREQDSFTPVDAETGPINPDDWPDLIAARGRYADWRAYFQDALETQPWREVAAVWVNRLAFGFSSSAAHGVLQTAHAVRALQSDATPARLRALANALAGWASRHSSLPIKDQPNQGVLDFQAALSWIKPLSDDHAPGEGAITAGYAQLVHAPGFAEEVSLVDLSGDLNARFDALMAVMAKLFLSLARTPYTVIVFTHAVTGSAAARTLSQIVPDAVGRQLLFRAFEHGAALKAAFTALALQSEAPRKALPPGDPARRAARHGDDHMIKLTEAVLDAYKRTHNPVFLDVIAQAFALLPGADAH